MSKRKPAAAPEPQVGGVEYALTIRQPWCGLSMAAIKIVENRSWSTAHRGRLWLHSAKTADNVARPSLASDMTLGSILGYVELVECLEIGKVPKRWRDQWINGPWCWIFKRPVPLRMPIPATGKLGLWRLTAAQIAAVTAPI